MDHQLLRTRLEGSGIRLELGGWAYGHGKTVEEAADDLVERLRRYAVAFRASGIRCSAEVPLPERALLDFLWELGELAARGEDIRARIFRGSNPA
jgi:hypothetical protein